MPRLATRPILIAALAAAVFAPLSGCAHGNKKKADTKFIARDVDTLYNLARDRLDRKQYKIAAQLFDEVERQHPYSIWARRAELMSAYSYYLGRSYNDSIASAQRFLSIHPGNRDAPYAYYRGEWLASIIRFRVVVDKYQTTTHVPEALERLTESYLALGVPIEAQKAAAVLGNNYPGSKWYGRAFNLMNKKAPTEGEAKAKKSKIEKKHKKLLGG
jgi:outer membrane protein assembly factor BamD (BamD/ComL family)